tara:strand:+ start:78 stop:911 length:834 start_codon:yes stop_codon:yes gene_type:complete
MNKAYIIGSGSIACRHSRILNRLGYTACCITSRISKLEDLYHENFFAKILSKIPRPESDRDIYVVANSTNLHTKTIKKILDYKCGRHQIYCEKPGPVEDLNVKMLNNLEHLPVIHRPAGNMVKLVHNADAKTWPSDIKWNERYIFRKKLGGGAVKTHSHEIVRAYYSRASKIALKLKKENEKLMTDIDGETIQTAVDLIGESITINLSIMTERPQRYWEWEDLIVSFYGEAPENKNKKEIYKLSTDEINQTYENMWASLLKESGPVKTDLSWLHAHG